MMQTILVLVVLAFAVWFAWKSWTPTGWDWKQGLAALAALAAAIGAWFTGWFGV